MPRPTRATWMVLIWAIAAAVLFHCDPWRPVVEPELLSTRRMARRLLPELRSLDSGRLDVRLERPTGADVHIGMNVLGVPQVFSGEVVLGPVDSEAFEGLVSSLQMAATIRAVSADATPAFGRGRIVVASDAVRLEIEIGEPTPDGAGVYARLAHEDGATWVIEREVAALLDPEPNAWVSRRLLPGTGRDVVAVTGDEFALMRGVDGLWRGTDSTGAHLLATAAVDARVESLLAARADPLLERDRGPEAAAGSLVVEYEGGQRAVVKRLGTCPTDSERVLVDRGPGLLACVLEDRLIPVADFGAMLEPRLAPHEYGRVLRIEQRLPQQMIVRRHGDGWVLKADDVEPRPVPEAEVFRWYEALHEAEVVLWAGRGDRWQSDTDLVLGTDTTARLRIQCGLIGKERVCRRDEGPWIALRSPATEVALTEDRLVERTLVALMPGEARAVELLPGPKTAGVRQGAHLDLGVWRLDAPRHPEGDAALDETALEDLLATLRTLRADAWIEPRSAALRTIRVEHGASAGTDDTLELTVFSGCIVRVDNGRGARIDAGDCHILQRDLLYRDPLRALIDRAHTLELELDGDTIRLRRSGEGFTVEGEQPVPTTELAALSAFRARGLRSGPPPGAAVVRVRILPRQGAAVTAELGQGWAHIGELDWYYVAE